MRLAYLVLPLLFACFASAASAQLGKPASPEGKWGFVSIESADTCTLSGEMTIKPSVSPKSDEAKNYACSFKAAWSCKTGVTRLVTTEQTCIATQAGDDLVITSRMEKISGVDPVTLTDFMVERYAPDNFTVTINSRGDAMDGIFKSYRTAPVKFRRRQELLS